MVADCFPSLRFPLPDVGALLGPASCFLGRPLFPFGGAAAAVTESDDEVNPPVTIVGKGEP